jgi:hypothetical protein
MPDNDTKKFIDELVSDRQKFNEFVYTPLDIAVEELNKRMDDIHLDHVLREYFVHDIPAEIKEVRGAFLSRSLATPNYETSRFLHIIEGYDDLTPIFWEYYNDKFTPCVNELKHSLGKLSFDGGRDKNGNIMFQNIRIIDFNTNDKKSISAVSTLWDQNMVDFHHELFGDQQSVNKVFYDASNWYKMYGQTVSEYYKYKIALFVKNGILFENLMIEHLHELDFIKNVFLPSIIEIHRITGQKPLIVALSPTEIEGDKFWLSYPSVYKEVVLKKISLI